MIRETLVSSILLAATGVATRAEAAGCAMAGYRATDGLVAAASADGVTIDWTGDPGMRLHMVLAIEAGTPVIRTLSIAQGNGAAATVLSGVRPDYSVTTGLRRISNQQLQALEGLGIAPERAAQAAYRWDPFWDAPLDLTPADPRSRYLANLPPAAGITAAGQPGLPRKAAEIERAAAQYRVTGCTVRSDGARISVVFPGVRLGAFDGALHFNVFRGTNLIRQEVVATTRRSWVAYKFSAGLTGMAIGSDTRLGWRDTAGNPQEERLGGATNVAPVSVAAANRVLALGGKNASLALFPEPHRFFWAREIAVNTGVNWFRKDGAASFSAGVAQADGEDASENPANWALYSARPGTQQRMPVYLYPTLGGATRAIDGARAFTHGDTYKPIPGYQVMNHHYHMDMGERLLAAGSTDVRLPDLVALKALGINIVSQIDSVLLPGFETRSAAKSGLPPRARPDPFAVIAAAVAGARASSDSNFLVMANQEVFGSPFGGHTDLLFGHPVYWDARKPGQPAVEPHPVHGKVYHIGDAADLLAMIRTEDVLADIPHPRTKGSSGYPDAVRTRDFFRDPHFFGIGMRWGMGLDGSERSLCEYRCWPLLDDASNWMAAAGLPLKRIISLSEVRHIAPGDDVYASQPVTYLKLATLPPADAPRPVIDALRGAESVWTTGEVLATNVAVRGAGRAARIEADLEWTFPLEFIEIVTGNGRTTRRRVVPATDRAPFGRERLSLPIDLRGAIWVRLAVWDNAANGAVSQPLVVTGR